MRGCLRSASRVVFLSILVVASVAVGHSFVAAVVVDPAAADRGETPMPPRAAAGSESGQRDAGAASVIPRFEAASDRTLPGENWSASRIRSAGPGDRNLTVVATQGFYGSDERGELAAFTANGTLVHYDDRYPVYFDVDPVPGERYTVEYVSAEHIAADSCSEFGFDRCTRNVVTRLNLTTGNEQRVYEEVTPRIYSARWHDVDRMNESTLVIADIVGDGVYAVDTRDGSVRWRWSASDYYSRDVGGASGDWTHINDVEVLADGRVMVSVRNMDSVVFLEPRNGTYAVDESWTLGSEDDYETLYEQHNPDYIPESQGGPAVVVADSENRRVVEYTRENGSWTRTWLWHDARLQWPRDVDRLPDGHSLIVDTHGDRLVELGPDDEVVWSARVGMAYDAERIGTGGESAGGVTADRRESAAREARDFAPNASIGGVPQEPTGAEQFWAELKSVVPAVVANGLLYVAPSWVRFTDLAFGVVVLVTGAVWGACEFYWSRYTVREVAASVLAGISDVVWTLVPYEPDR